MKSIKNLPLLFFLITIISCNNNSEKSHFVKTNDFINQVGTYYLYENKIVIKKFDNGSLIYGVADSRNRVLYQRSIFNSFSGYSNWGLYIDAKKNIWFYTSDYQEYSVLLKDSIDNKYFYKKIDNESIEIPNEFKLKLK